MKRREFLGQSTAAAVLMVGSVAQGLAAQSIQKATNMDLRKKLLAVPRRPVAGAV